MYVSHFPYHSVGQTGWECTRNLALQGYYWWLWSSVTYYLGASKRLPHFLYRHPSKVLQPFRSNAWLSLHFITSFMLRVNPKSGMLVFFLGILTQSNPLALGAARCLLQLLVSLNKILEYYWRLDLIPPHHHIYQAENWELNRIRTFFVIFE